MPSTQPPRNLSSQLRVEEATAHRVLSDNRDGPVMRALIMLAEAKAEKALAALKKAPASDLVKYQQNLVVWDEVVHILRHGLPT